MVEKYPFIENKLNNYYIRAFKNTDPYDLKWHWDEEDRIIEVIGETDWMFQFDNDLPISISGRKIFIEKLMWHRIIKGSGDLIIKVFKFDN